MKKKKRKLTKDFPCKWAPLSGYISYVDIYLKWTYPLSGYILVVDISVKWTCLFNEHTFKWTLKWTYPLRGHIP